MAIIGLLCFAGFVYTIYVMNKYTCPWANKFFSMIYNENHTDRMEVVQRIKDLYVDGDVPAESALLMAATESGKSEKEILNAFGAMNAIDLMDRIKGNPRGALALLRDLLESGYKKNM
jgi:hypothetical protein